MIKNDLFIALIFVQLLFPCIVYSQESKLLLLKGKVISESRLPLYNASVKEIGSIVGAIADKNGYFSITLKKTPTVIKVSYIGYNTITQEIKLNQNNKDSLYVLITLKEISYPIKTVEINADSEKVCCKPKQFLFDYELKNNLIWLLYKEAKKTNLNIIDENFNPQLSINIHLKGFITFDKDCYNNLYFKTDDSVYTCSINEVDQPIFQCNYSHDFYLNNIKSLIAAYKYQLFTKTENLIAAEVCYYEYDTIHSTSKLIYQYKDVPFALWIEDKTVEIVKLSSQIDAMGIHDMGDIWIPQLYMLRENNQNKWFLNNVLKKPLFCPLKVVRDSIYIFNHVIDSVIVFTPYGKFIRDFPISYDQKNALQKEIITNESNTKAYFKFQHNGLVTLREINLDNGNTANEKKIKKLYPDKMRISDNYVYYLYENIYDNDNVKKLLRETLK